MAENRDVRHVRTSALLLLLACWGCGSPIKPVDNSPEAKEDRLKATVQQLASDPNASDEVKSMAARVNRQIESDKQERDFAKGN
jgi:hypothetical protein